MQKSLAKHDLLVYIACMKAGLPFKKQLISAILAPFFVAGIASAQTPISTNIHLSGSCIKCDLSNRVMPGLSLQGANFSGSNFSHSNISGAKFGNSNLVSASFHKSYLMQVDGEGVNFNYAVLSGATISNAKLINSDFTGADLRKTDLNNSDFSGSNFTRAKLNSADAMGTVFIGSLFTDAVLKRSDFSKADFSKAKFIRTKFGDAVLSEARFDQAKLIDSDLSNVKELYQDQITTACGTKNTKLPEGLSLRLCAADITFMAEKSDRQPMAARAKSAPRASVLKMGRRQSIASQNLLEAMELIDQSMRDLPMESPTRKRLSQARTKLESLRKDR